MPEAPEVQTVLNVLEKELKGHEVVSAEIFHPKLSASMPYEDMERKLMGQHFRKFSRIGKYLILETDDYDWIVHLRMEGKFYVLPEAPDPKDKHIHALFGLDDGRVLAYKDVRKFGRMYLYDKTDDVRSLPLFAKVGKDVLDPMSPRQFLASLPKKKAIKTSLLDQSVIAGIGNIYADEILFASGIHPETKGESLDLEDASRILDNTRKIMEDAIRHKGTTIRSYTSSLGVKGGYQGQLQVHRKEKEPCPVCGTPIEKIKVGQRSTYVCPQCQIKK